MAVRNPEDASKQMDSYNVVVGVDSVDRGLSRINLASLIVIMKLLTCNCKRCLNPGASMHRL